jgi:hypothetical protein
LRASSSEGVIINNINIIGAPNQRGISGANWNNVTISNNTITNAPDIHLAVGINIASNEGSIAAGTTGNIISGNTIDFGDAPALVTPLQHNITKPSR